MASGLALGLSRKVGRVLDLRTETPDVLNALETLSTFYTDNSATERKHLRATIERRGVSLSAEYLAAADSVIQACPYQTQSAVPRSVRIAARLRNKHQDRRSQVMQALDHVQGSLDGLMSGCQRSRDAVVGAQGSTAGLLAETERLQLELAANEKRSGLVQGFLEQYQLSPAEVAALQSSSIGEEFFEALSRVRSIHANCKALLRTHHQRAGLELMDAMSAHQEGAYERLCRWVQSECRKLGDSDGPEVSPLLQQASQVLRERPVLFKYCAMEVATTRHNALFQRFIAALTRGGPHGMPRPIEMHAHDPRRYLGDMLAWVHQSLAGERELMTSLFGDDAAKHTQRGEAETSVADMPRTAALLDRVFESICRPLKVRIEQVLLATPPLLLCSNLSQLLAFYTSLVDRLLGNEASLTRTLAGCRQLAARLFQEQLRKAGEKLSRYPPQPPSDLTPPPQLVEACQQLADIIASSEASFEAEDGGTSGGSGDDASPVLEAAVKPLLETIQKSSEVLGSRGPGGSEVQQSESSAQRLYLINCLSMLEQVLGTRSSCRGEAAKAHTAVEGHVSALVRSHAGAVLVKSGLAEIVDRMRLYNEGKSNAEGVMAADPALQLPRITQALKSFMSLLTEPEAQPEFRSLQVPRIRTEAVSRVAAALADGYQVVYESLADAACGYGEEAAASGALRHTPEEIRTILGIV